MGYKTTWQDALFGKAQYDDPCIYFVGPEIEGERFCCYIGQTTNHIGNRLFSHDRGHNSRMPDLVRLYDNLMVELFSPDEVFDIYRPYLDKAIGDDWRGKYGLFGFMRAILDVIEDCDKLDYAEHLSLWFYAPGMNVMLSGTHILHKYASNHYWGWDNYRMLIEYPMNKRYFADWDARRRQSPLYVERGGKVVENFSFQV